MVLRQTLPPSAETYAADRRLEIQAAVAAAQRQWRRMGSEFDPSYDLIEPNLLRIADTAQARVAALGSAYIPAVLAETGQTRAVAPRFKVNVDSLIGTAGDGLPTEGLLYGAVTHAKARIGAGAAVSEALTSSSLWLATAVGTLLSDTGRAAEKLQTMARPVAGYVRMLNPPSCGQCVILAGKWQRSAITFRRHYGCDCATVPASESIAGDLLVDPRAYFDSLDGAGQIRLMGGKANAEVVRDFNGDMNQIINAYRKETGGPSAIRSAQIYGHNLKYTTEGTTRRGLAHARMSQAGYVQAAGEAKAGRYMRLRAPRLMPESIAKIATSRADKERLLGLYGWLG